MEKKVGEVGTVEVGSSEEIERERGEERKKKRMEWCSSRQEAQVGRERERGRKEEEQKGHGKWVQVGRGVGDGEMGYRRRDGSGGEEGMREREKRVGERTEGGAGREESTGEGEC